MNIFITTQQFVLFLQTSPEDQTIAVSEKQELNVGFLFNLT